MPGKESKRPLTHAGCVTYRQSQDKTFYLVVSSSDGANWVLPKGHIEPNESPEETALRELKEEAGVVGEIVDRLPVQSYQNRKGKAVVQYFLVKKLGPCQKQEDRIVRWEVQTAALDLLSFEDAKRVLREGAEKVRRFPGNGNAKR